MFIHEELKKKILPGYLLHSCTLVKVFCNALSTAHVHQQIPVIYYFYYFYYYYYYYYYYY
jgi:hypothetical protein